MRMCTSWYRFTCIRRTHRTTSPDIQNSSVGRTWFQIGISCVAITRRAMIICYLWSIRASNNIQPESKKPIQQDGLFDFKVWRTPIFQDRLSLRNSGVGTQSVFLMKSGRMDHHACVFRNTKTTDKHLRLWSTDIWHARFDDKAVPMGLGFKIWHFFPTSLSLVGLP